MVVLLALLARVDGCADYVWCSSSEIIRLRKGDLSHLQLAVKHVRRGASFSVAEYQCQEALGSC